MRGSGKIMASKKKGNKMENQKKITKKDLKNNEYADKFYKAIRKSQSSFDQVTEVKAIVDKIYADGFEDGTNTEAEHTRFYQKMAKELTKRLRQKKQYRGSVIHVYNGVLQESIPFTTGEQAEKIFLKLCRKHISEFKKFFKKEVESCIEDGYCGNDNMKNDISIMWF